MEDNIRDKAKEQDKKTGEFYLGIGLSLFLSLLLNYLEKEGECFVMWLAMIAAFYFMIIAFIYGKNRGRWVEKFQWTILIIFYIVLILFVLYLLVSKMMR